MAVLTLAGIGIIALMAYLIWSGYRGAMHGAEITTRNYALIIEERLDATLRRADAHIREMAREVPLDALNPSAVPQFAGRIDAMLDAHQYEFPEISRLSVADADGNVLYPADYMSGPPTNIADREHFRQARDSPPGSLVFSDVVASRALGRSTVVIARAIRDREGGFRGVALALLDLNYFEELFRSLDVGPHGNVSIYRRDDFTLVARWPHVPGSVNNPPLLGKASRELVGSGHKRFTLRIVAEADGRERVFSDESLDGYPFIIGVGVAVDDALADWRTRSLVVGALGIMLLGLLVAVAYRLWRSEHKLREAKLAADAANEAKSAFLANMSHELRTPLNAIIGFAHVIGSQMFGRAAGDRYAAYGRDILQAGNHLLHLINNVLDLSKIEAGKFELRDERIRIADLVEACLALVRLEAQAKEIAVTDRVPLDLPQVQTDETALRQIVVNLLSNAIKFTPAGGRVELSASLAADGGLVLAVSDNGVGMTGEEIAEACEPFVQIENPLTKRQAGTGLGLPISKRLAELLEGSLEIESVKGHGTTVRVTMPAARVLQRGGHPAREAA